MKEVLIGIPMSTAERPEGEITNAELGYIHEYGAPEANIPARPFLTTGVESVKGKALELMKKAIIADLENKPKLRDKILNQIGLLCVSAVKEKIDTGPFVPLAPSTIRARGDKTAQPLINTGNLQNSITYVIREAGHGDAERI